MEGFIKFFGSGGARFVVSKQIRATGGLWLNYRNTNLYIDPGPGSLVRIHEADGQFDPGILDGIILTHKHIDHANDVNVMIEALTEGGFKKRGTLFCPEDAIGDDHVVFRYARNYIQNVTVMKEKEHYTVKDITFSLPVRHFHPVETYGLKFHLNRTIALITDTLFFNELPGFYQADILIINVLRSKPISKSHPIYHLSTDDVVRIVTEVKPEIAIMTHFGMQLIKEGPDEIASRLSRETGVRIIAAHDGMQWEF